MNRLPEQFESVMKEKLGNDFSEFEKSLQQPSPTSIRLNPKKTASLSVDKPVLWSDHGRYLDVRPSFTLDPLFHAGTYYVQEASSMFLEQAIKQTVDLNESLNVLDLCAAPGGKSTHILSLINENSLLISNEVIRSRASILAENIQKWGYPNCMVTNSDPKDFQELEGFFDLMIIDAPCSGEGLFRKDPEAMKEWSPQNVALCSSRQKRIMADVWPSLKENGILIYCTCTYNEAENEENLNWLQQQHEVEFLDLKLDPRWNIDEVKKEGVTGYRFFPHRVKGEGFFISVIRKKQEQHSLRLKPKKIFTFPVKKVSESLSQWITDAEKFLFFQHQDTVSFFPKEKMAEADVLFQHLKIVNTGTSLAAVKHEKLIPDHALALSIHLQHNNFNLLPVTRDEAIHYLRKDAISLETPSKGYYLITYENAALGWINGLGNRYNNMYPSEWRIRMTPT